MAEVVLFHAALGLTPGVTGLADDWRAAGHTVHTPDLFAGRTFGSVGDGVAHAQQVGFAEVTERGVRAVAGLPDGLVYAGMSLGVLPAQRLAQTRPGARAAVLLDACVPTAEFGSWPARVPVQVHGMDADPIFAGEGDVEAARALVAEARAGGATADLYLYPGDGHLFADRTSPSHDAGAAALLTGRVLGLLAGL